MTSRLFSPPRPVPHPDTWTDAQQQAWALITTTPGGVWADEVGARVHAHSDDERCDFCATRGKQLARSAALAPHVVKRRTGRIEAREPRYRAVLPGSQLAELPDDLFGAA